MIRLELDTSWGRLRLVGGSRAGEGSVLLAPQLRLALDAGHPLRGLVPMHTVFISHGHGDHLLGLPAWAGQRHLQGMRRGRVLAPEPAIEPVRRLLELLATLEGGRLYDVEVHGVSAGGTWSLRDEFELRFFATSHWLETLGCCLWWNRRRLLPELAGVPSEDLERARAEGATITETLRTPLLAYVADTGPEVFDREPWLYTAEVLVTECTFVGPDELDRARRFGHMHVDDLVDRAELFTNRHMILTHLSRRHRVLEGEARVRGALEPALAPRLHFLNVEWQ